MQSPEEIVQRIELEIERYLDENKDPADSAEGVRGFWLPAELRKVSLEHVIEALDRLEKRGLVTKRQVGTGFVYAKGGSKPWQH